MIILEAQVGKYIYKCFISKSFPHCDNLIHCFRFFQGGEHLDSDEFVYVDAHVLGKPTLADVNGDGNDSNFYMIICHSYLCTESLITFHVPFLTDYRSPRCGHGSIILL